MNLSCNQSISENEQKKRGIAHSQTIFFINSVVLTTTNFYRLPKTKEMPQRPTEQYYVTSNTINSYDVLPEHKFEPPQALTIPKFPTQQSELPKQPTFQHPDMSLHLLYIKKATISVQCCLSQNIAPRKEHHKISPPKYRNIC